MEIQREYERIRNLFKDCDSNMLELVDGTIWEAAKIRVQLDGLNDIAKETGLVATNPKNPMQQRELPVSKLLTKQRANYLNYISKLASILGKAAVEDSGDDLSEFE